MTVTAVPPRSRRLPCQRGTPLDTLARVEEVPRRPRGPGPGYLQPPKADEGIHPLPLAVHGYVSTWGPTRTYLTTPEFWVWGD